MREQVREAEVAYDGALRAYNAARNALSASYADLTAFRRALQAATRGTNDPYQPPYLANPLDSLLEEERMVEEPQPTPPVTPVKPKAEKVTKKSIVLKALAKANGTGMKLPDVMRAIPSDAPIKITKADLYRALPRLVDEERAWRDEQGFYHIGQPNSDAEAVSQLFAELDEEE